MVLAASQIIVKKGDNWLPTSAVPGRESQYRNYLNRLAEIGRILRGGFPSGFDVKLPNGFRAVGVYLPVILDQPPLVAFVRVDAPAVVGSTVFATPAPRTSGVVSSMTRPMPGTTAIPANLTRQPYAPEGIASRTARAS